MIPGDTTITVIPKINHAISGDVRTIFRGEIYYFPSLPDNLHCTAKSGNTEVKTDFYLGEPLSDKILPNGLFVQDFSLVAHTEACTLDVSFVDGDEESLYDIHIPERRFENCVKVWTKSVKTSDAPYAYNNYIQDKHRFNASKPQTTVLDGTLRFSIIVPLYHTPVHLFHEMASSVIEQTYQNWQLVLINSTPDDVPLTDAVTHLSAQDERITVLTLPKNLGITGNTNAGVKAATGDFVCFFDHDDIIEPDILAEYAKAVEFRPEIDMLYCDEDVLFENGTYRYPNFKSDFNIDQLRNNNYICHMLCVRKSIINSIGPTPDGFDGAQDHWLTLRASELARKVWHVRKVLYHWRATENSTALDPDSKPYATQAGIRAVQDHLDRIGLQGHVSEFGRPFTYRVSYSLAGEPRVTIVLWNCKDSAATIEHVKEIRKHTNYENYDFLCILTDGHFSQADLEEASNSTIRFANFAKESYFEDLNSALLAQPSDYLVFMDRFIQPDSPNWLSELLGFASRQGTGVVGPKILNQDNTIYHAGYAITLTGVNELFIDYPGEFLAYGGLNDIVRNISAVSAACMVIKTDIFRKIGGFSQEYASICWDADLCMKARCNGYENVYVSNVGLKSTTFKRPMDMTGNLESKKSEKFFDQLMFIRTWKDQIFDGDPYYSQNFDYDTYGPLYCSSDWLKNYDEEYVRTGILKIAANAYHAIVGEK